MARRRWIFDNEGNIWRALPGEFRYRLASRLTVDKPHDHAITNLGFASREDTEGWTHIRLDKHKISAIALTSLLYHLSDRPTGRAALSVLNTDWEHEIFGDPRSLYARLEQLSVEIFDEGKQRFLHEPIELDGLRSHDPQVVLYRHWKSQSFEAHNMADLCSDLFGGRFTIARVQPNAEMIIEHMGHGYRVYDNSYVNRACGTRHQDEPDTVYGQWIARTHREVHKSGIPLLEDVDAIIGISRSGRQRVGYRRIVLPFTNPLGEPFLVTASTNCNVNLR